MSEDLVTIGSFAVMVAAHAARARLEAAGIRAYLVGEEVANSLWHVGSALGGIKLQVAESDVERVKQLVEEEEGAEEQGTGDGRPWRCRPCQEVVDGEFDVCWSCGLPRADVEDENYQPAPSTNEDSYAENSPLSSERPIRYDEPAGTENPYASPALEKSEGIPAKPLQIVDDDSEQLVQRAYRSAIIGLLLCPGVLHLYSFGLLLLIGGRIERLTAKSKRRFMLAFIVDMIAIAAVILLLQSDLFIYLTNWPFDSFFEDW